MRTTLLLDVDGTLIDSFPGICTGFVLGLDAVGWPHPDEEFLRHIPGPPITETMAAMGMSPDQVERAMAAYSAYMSDEGWQNFTVFEGMPELVDEWRQAGFQIVTATSKSERFARKALERAGFLGSIDFLGAADNDGPRRKKVDVIAHVLDKVNPDKPLMIGDRRHDFEGAAHFDIPSVAVTWGYADPAEYSLGTYVAHTPEELREIVNGF